MASTMTRRTLVTIGLCFGIFIAALDTTIVGTAMPTVIASLGGTELYTWVFAAYMLAFTTSTPIFGKLSDLFGQKVLFASGIGLFLLGSVLCGNAQTMAQLIIFRGLQGIGGGALMAMSFTILGHVFSPTERPKMQGVLSAVWAVASVIGPATGGFIIDHLSWRWTFYVNIPIGAIPAALILFNLRDARTREAGARTAIDFVGALTLAASILSLLLALLLGDTNGWASAGILALFILSAALLALFVWNESRSSEPIVPLSLFRLRTFSVCNLENLLSGAALFGITAFIPLFVQGVQGRSATLAGMALMPLSVAWSVGSIIGGQTVNRVGYRNITVAAMAFMATGFYLLTGLSIDSAPFTVGLDMFVAGLGMGLLTPTATSAVQNAVPRYHMGVASSSIAFYRNIGGTLGVSVLGAVLNSQMVLWASRLVDSSLVNSVNGVNIALHGPQILLKPELSALLPEAALSALEHALLNSLHTVFTLALLMATAGFLASWLVPNSTPRKDAERMARIGTCPADVRQ